MQDPDIQVSKVKEVVDLADKHHLAELTITEDDLTITVRRVSPQHVTQAVSVVETGLVEDAVETVEGEVFDQDEAVDQNVFELVAPLVGVFYRAPSPDAPNFVEVGDQVEAGQEVGLIEAMKVFSSVPCEVAGSILEIPVKNSQLVHQGDVLMRIKLSE